MKLLLKNGRFSGGASFSLLEYAKLGRRMGHEVTVHGEFTDGTEKYRDAGVDQLFDIDKFESRKPLKNLRLLKHFLHRIQTEKPDVIIAITEMNVYFTRFITMWTGTPALYLIPGSSVFPQFSVIMKRDEVIVFSEENKQDLLKYHFPVEQIHVFPHRLDFTYYPEPDFGTLPKQEKKLNLLLISRLDYDKIHSVYNVFNTALELSRSTSREVTLTIAGEGKNELEVRQKAEEWQNAYGLSVHILGHVPNVHEQIPDYDMVAGKGRSIIDGLYLGKPGIVVNESYQFKLVTEDNIQELAAYNFAGRNIESSTDYDELLEYLRVDAETRSRIRDYVVQNYDINAVSPQIEAMINERAESRKQPSWLQKARALLFLAKMNYYVFKLELWPVIQEKLKEKRRNKFG
ncbi:glycosyltransferase family 4 protein [Marinococcus halotolerans]|uniref:glycosyltransferase family 4 protein n=1 Tax=Marinococcus halotolerans TaxID=301092 RepID=UPI0003B5C539|nr:glycosyltransferase family 4 protein [Marinococcus halotolerans]